MNLTKLSQLTALFVALACPIIAAEKSNVLFISVDDWNDWVGAYGGNQAITPNLDKLAARGVAFRNAHASAVYCAPSRTSLMTGRNPFTIGAYHDQPHFAPQNTPEIKDVSIWFRENGYHTAGGGKIYHHMPGFIDFRGWDEYFHWSDLGKAKAWHLNSWGEGAPTPKDHPVSPIAKYLYQKTAGANSDTPPKKVNSHMEWGALPNSDEEKMADTICANWAAEFLANYSKEKPFFLGFGSYAPHKPNFVPQKYFDLYKLADIEQPGMEPGDLKDLPPMLQKRSKKRKEHIHDPMRELKCGKKAVQGYLASLSYADAMVGQVLDALAESPHAANTIVVLWSDNGYHLGEKGAWAKHTLWERTSNVPFIWAGPGIAQGQIVDTTVSLLDTYPTLVELCALPANPETEGVSLASTLKDPATAVDRTVIQSDTDQFALINQEWRYIRTTNDEEQLYQVKNDPGEHDNLAANPEYAEQLEQFRAQLPKEIAPAGLRPPDMRLKLNGDQFEWTEKKAKKGPKS